MQLKNMEIENLMWGEYRRIKLRLIVMVLGWMPFGMLLMSTVPKIFSTYVPCYVLALAYVVVMAYTMLMYMGYPCPNCGTSFRGRQLYRRICPQCSTPINVSGGESVPMTESKTETLMWVQYRHVKLRLLVMLLGLIPFGIISMVAVPRIFGTYWLGVALALIYMAVLAYALLVYWKYRCPNCGNSLKGRQLFSRTCLQCGLPINISDEAGATGSANR